MYNEHFGFIESPFSATPSSRFFYANGIYREALANLRYGIEWRKGLILMTGEVGTGKTTLLDKVMRDLTDTIDTVFVSYDQLNSSELLQLVSRKLELPTPATGRVEMVEQLRSHVLEMHKQGRTVALLVDEAQNLSDEMFEALRFLSNFEADDTKLLQIVLTGQPELEVRLQQPGLRHLKQRIVLHSRLAPLAQKEVGSYIEFRLKEAGCRGRSPFDPAVVERIAIYSGGIPRLINIICDNALLLAFAASTKGVSLEMLDEVARDLGLVTPVQPLAGGDFRRATGSAAAPRESELPARRPAKAEAAATPARQRWIWIPMGLSVILLVLGGVAGALYSQQIKSYLEEELPVPVITGGPDKLSAPGKMDYSAAGTPTPVLHIESVAANGAAATPEASVVETAPVPAQPDPPPPQSEPVKAKARDSRLGRFEIADPFSFVRGSPRADAPIIATLPPATPIRVVSASGDYFKIQANHEGRTITGYVHREDAFFERTKTARPALN